MLIFLFTQGLNEFLKCHPLLEYLHFDLTNIGCFMEEEEYVFGEGDWSLPCLKVLVYKCIIPLKSNILFYFKKFIFQILHSIYWGYRSD